ncbi:hypothetical protein IMG5_058520 [Ichthyophthirius multifiliis]|uniref:RING-type E3 ubiquitin transferase n=1 Tax=Ichthyophthirius multifiliis TaxID=5932 RepID=G0QNH0_ICHMU|nr:hypothetical protein IMG5_058520 [Ichthyophthirius multifiliis]EGR33232.1 hypothetical protein IMG5_058520 [Ichthyophthirius multifiliis]|eukprot:XP_004037218.1 hypothetical protein IMG5_058520 [Ichthyophthirius multifiliis]
MAIGGSSGQVKLWYIAGNEIMASLELEKGKENINMINFCENGYFFVAGSEDANTISIWDLRKGNTACSFGGEGDKFNYTAVQFDDLGSVIALGNQQGFGQYSSYILSCSEDQQLAFSQQ